MIFLEKEKGALSIILSVKQGACSLENVRHIRNPEEDTRTETTGHDLNLA